MCPRGHVPVVGYHDHGVAAFRQLLEQGKDLVTLRGIQRPRGFVRQDHLRVVHQRPRDGDALLFASRQLRWLVVHPVTQAEGFE